MIYVMYAGMSSKMCAQRWVVQLASAELSQVPYQSQGGNDAINH